MLTIISFLPISSLTYQNSRLMSRVGLENVALQEKTEKLL